MIAKKEQEQEKTGMNERVPAAYNKIYQLKITLEDIQPPIWRRILVRGNVKMRKLHHILQITMGWTNSHLHQFWVEDACITEPHVDLERDVYDDKKLKLSRITDREG